VHCIDHRADIWSFGCILYELLSCGDRLIHDLDFHSRKDQQQFVQERLNELTYRMECSNAGNFPLSLGTVKLLGKCLRADPRERASLE
jgi:serine/threonine protein kinase